MPELLPGIPGRLGRRGPPKVVPRVEDQAGNADLLRFFAEAAAAR